MTFWKIIKSEKMSPSEARSFLNVCPQVLWKQIEPFAFSAFKSLSRNFNLNSSKNKSQSDLNEILFSRYSINYNVTPEVYRKGTLHFKVRANLISLKNLFLKFYLKFKNKDADGTIIEKHIDISKNWDELNRCWWLYLATISVNALVNAINTSCLNEQNKNGLILCFHLIDLLAYTLIGRLSLQLHVELKFGCDRMDITKLPNQILPHIRIFSLFYD